MDPRTGRPYGVGAPPHQSYRDHDTSPAQYAIAAAAAEPPNGAAPSMEMRRWVDPLTVSLLPTHWSRVMERGVCVSRDWRIEFDPRNAHLSSCDQQRVWASR